MLKYTYLFFNQLLVKKLIIKLYHGFKFFYQRGEA